MPAIPFQNRGFAGPAIPPVGLLPVSWARLAWAAMTVGATPMTLGGTPRPLVELLWRAGLVSASVESGPRWTRSAAYDRLDRSEKSAVSYFLGMAQAKVTAEMLLGVPNLVHLDAVLAALGETTNKSRPDFVGFDFASQTFTVAIEAKGRTRGLTDDVVATAKAQAALLPSAVGTTSSIRAASVAYFDSDAHGCAYIEDPPSAYSQLDDRVDPALVLTVYYRSLVAAVLGAGGLDEELSDEQTVMVRLEPIDAWLGLPRVVVDLMRPLPLTGSLDRSSLHAVGADIDGALLELPGRSEAAQASSSWSLARGQGSRDSDGLRGLRRCRRAARSVVARVCADAIAARS